MESSLQPLRPIFFVAFFLGTGLAYLLQDRFQLRRIHLTVFLLCLTLASLTGAQFLPVVTLHKFVQEGPEERTEYEIRIADAQGDEILLDARAIDPVPASRISALGEHLVHNYDRKDRANVGQYILDESRTYRTYVESNPFVRSDTVTFPRHGFGYRWTSNLLTDFGEFTAVRVYEINITYSEDGTDTESRSESLEYEYTGGSSEISSAVNRVIA